MKKSKLRPLKRSARKTAHEAIKLSLITALKEVTGILGASSKKLEKEMEKGSKQLAKKLSKKIKIDTSAVLPVSAASANDKPVVKDVPAKTATTKTKPEKVL